MAGWVLVKVALLSDCYLPRLGGIEVQVHDLAHHLTRAGHTVEVFTATGDPAQPRSTHPTADDVGMRVHRFDLGLPGGIPINPLAVPEIRRRLGGGGFDVAHVHMGVVSPFAVDMARVALGLHIPTAVTGQCVLDGSATSHRTLGYAGRWAERGAALSAVSAMAADRVRAILPGGHGDVRVLGNGIDVGTWARTSDRPETEPFRITAIQRLVRRKRPDALIDVLLRTRELVPSSVELSATIVGDGPQRSAITQATSEHPWISVPGRLTRPALRELHWDAQAVVSMARREAFGFAALEARTAGLPVVALAGTGMDDFVHDGVEGLLATDDERVARALARLATDTDLRTRIRDHNRSVPPAQAWPDVVAGTLAEYRRAIEQGQRS